MSNSQVHAPYIVVAQRCRHCSVGSAQQEIYRVAGLNKPQSIETCSACQGAGIQYIADKNEDCMVTRLHYRFVVLSHDHESKQCIDSGKIEFGSPTKLKDVGRYVGLIELDTYANRVVGAQYIEIQIMFEAIDGTVHPYEMIPYAPLTKQSGVVLSLVKRT